MRPTGGEELGGVGLGHGNGGEVQDSFTMTCGRSPLRARKVMEPLGAGPEEAEQPHGPALERQWPRGRSWARSSRKAAMPTTASAASCCQSIRREASATAGEGKTNFGFPTGGGRSSVSGCLLPCPRLRLRPAFVQPNGALDTSQGIALGWRAGPASALKGRPICHSAHGPPRWGYTTAHASAARLACKKLSCDLCRGAQLGTRTTAGEPPRPATQERGEGWGEGSR